MGPSPLSVEASFPTTGGTSSPAAVSIKGQDQSGPVQQGTWISLHMVPMTPLGNTCYGHHYRPQMQQEHETRHNRRQLFGLDNTVAPCGSTAHQVAMAPVAAQPWDTNMATGGRPDPAPGFLMLRLSAENSPSCFYKAALFSHILLILFLTGRHREVGRFFMILSTGKKTLREGPSGTDTFGTSLPPGCRSHVLSGAI